MTAYIFTIVICLCLGMGIGVLLTVVALYKCGVLSADDLDDRVREMFGRDP